MGRRLRLANRPTSAHWKQRNREFTRLIETLKATHDAMEDPKPSWPEFRDKELQAQRKLDAQKLASIGTDLTKIRTK